MQTTWSEHNWFDDNRSIKRHFIAFSASVVIVILLLAVPLRMKYNFIEEKKILNLELIKIKSVVKQIETLKPIAKPIPKSIPKSISEPQKNIPQSNVESKQIKPIKAESQVADSGTIKSEPFVPEAAFQNSLPSSAEIYNLSYGKVRLNPIDEHFKARTDHQDDFVFKKMERPEWYKIKKHINEEIDKPSTYMEFYSLGIEGSVERFFDKISYKKRFTTKYGTKIDCGGVGPLVICSWK
jgi:hypothetical protein